MLRNAEFKQPDRHLSQEGQEASFPIDHITPIARGNATEPDHHTLACVSLSPARNWVRFACPIPPRFDLNCDLPKTNTRANWLRFGAFVSPPVPFPRDSRTTVHSPPATRFTSHVPRPTIVGVRHRYRAPSRVQHSHPAGVNMLHNATFQGFLPPSGPQISAKSGSGGPLLGTRETWVVPTVSPAHCSPVSRPTLPAPRSAPHAVTSGVRSCAAPPPLATACHRPPYCQSPNGARSRRTTPYIHYITEPGDSCGQINLFLGGEKRDMAEWR